MNKTLTILITILIVLIIALLSGCGLVGAKPEPVCATTPVVVHDTSVRYVPIDAALTAKIRDPGPRLVAGATFGDAIKAAENRLVALWAANLRFACIAAIAGRPYQPSSPSTCGTLSATDAVAP